MSAKSAISFLKKAIKLEYNDVFLYHKEKQNAALSDKVRGVFEAFGNQEITHLDLFSIELKKLADEPTIELAPPSGAKSLREILFYHKASEENTIAFYEAFAEVFDDEDFKKKLLKVISDEKTHLHILEKLIKEIR
ncbi:MAG: ferritin-like domain-containing protein [Endomicrobiia bacterium]|nr:ferritin-like domain-containing protein [Endomicrobiia bacterium]